MTMRDLVDLIEDIQKENRQKIWRNGKSSITLVQWCEVKSVDRDTEIVLSLWLVARRRYVVWPRTTISSRALTQLIFFVQCSFGCAWLHPRRLSTLFQIHLNYLPIELPLNSLLTFIHPSLPQACSGLRLSWSRSCPVSLELNILTILHEKPFLLPRLVVTS